MSSVLKVITLLGYFLTTPHLEVCLISEAGNSFLLEGHIRDKIVLCGRPVYLLDLFDSTFLEKELSAIHFSKGSILGGIFDETQKVFEGHIKVLCGSHVARGPDVSQA